MDTDARRIFAGLVAMELPEGFEDRVARETGWNRRTVAAAIFEYRCFLLLGAVSDSPMTPSADIDAVWHEHILHTRHYQEVLPSIMGKPFHHDPGTKADAETHRRQYQRTWRLYRRIFGRDPNSLVWPRPLSRIRDVFRRSEPERHHEDLSQAWSIAALDTVYTAPSQCAPTSHDSGASSQICHVDSSNGSDSSSGSASSCGSSCGGGCGGD